MGLIGDVGVAIAIIQLNDLGGKAAGFLRAALGVPDLGDQIAVGIDEIPLIGLVHLRGKLVSQKVQRLLVIGYAPLGKGVLVDLCDRICRGELAGLRQQLPLGLEPAVEVVIVQRDGGGGDLFILLLEIGGLAPGLVDLGGVVIRRNVGAVGLGFVALVFDVAVALRFRLVIVGVFLGDTGGLGGIVGGVAGRIQVFAVCIAGGIVRIKVRVFRQNRCGLIPIVGALAAGGEKFIGSVEGPIPVGIPDDLGGELLAEGCNGDNTVGTGHRGAGSAGVILILVDGSLLKVLIGVKDAVVAVPQLGEGDVKIGVVGRLGQAVGPGAVRLQIPILPHIVGIVRIGRIVFVILLILHRINGELGGVQTVDQNGAVRVDGGVRIVVSQPNGQLLHLDAGADGLHGVLHVDFHILRELVDQQIPLVPHLQGVVPVDVGLTDIFIQVADIGENGVYLGDILLKLLHCVVVVLLQIRGVGAQQIGQVFAGGTHLHVVFVVAGLGGEIVQRVIDLAELGGNQAKFLALRDLAALARLVQNLLKALQALQQAVKSAHVGAFGAVLNVQIGAAQLGEAIAQNALAHLDAGGGIIAVGAGVVKTSLVQPLPGVARRVDVGNVVACHGEAGLGGINRQTGLREGTKRTDTHKCNSFITRKSLIRPSGAKIRFHGGGRIRRRRRGVSGPALGRGRAVHAGEDALNLPQAAL